MSQVYNELIDLNASCLKLRESIHKNEIFLKATDKQEESFHNMLTLLIARTKDYVDKHKDMKHVIELYEFYEKAKQYVHDELTFDFNELKQQLDQHYEEERKTDDGNFVASAEILILWPLRMINERMYRILTGEKYDERFDSLFTEADRY